MAQVQKNRVDVAWSGVAVAEVAESFGVSVERGLTAAEAADRLARTAPTA